jgi:cardiolipin-specific phospholipase
MPITFYYGDRDWMDYRAGQRTIDRNQYFSAEAPEAGLSQVFIIPDSDHHLYLDNPAAFAALIKYDVELTESYL